MARLLKANRSVLVALGLALAAVAIVAGCGGRGGSSAASHRPTANAAGNWRALPNAPEAIAAGRTTVWTGSEMIVTGIKLDANGTFINSTEVAEAYNPGANTWRLLPAPPKTENYCRRSAAWTGEEMLVWGCELTAYNPASNQWRRLPERADPPRDRRLDGPRAARLGRRLLWGRFGRRLCLRPGDEHVAKDRPSACERTAVAAWGVDRSRARHLQRPRSRGRARWRCGIQPEDGHVAADPLPTQLTFRLDCGVRRERDPCARCAPGHRLLLQFGERPLAAIAQDGPCRRRSRRCLDGKPPDRVGGDDKRIRSGEEYLDGSRILSARATSRSSGRVDRT